MSRRTYTKLSINSKKKQLIEIQLIADLAEKKNTATPSIPATLVPYERVFSAAEHIVFNRYSCPVPILPM